MSPLFLIRKSMILFLLGASLVTVIPAIFMAAEFLYFWYYSKSAKSAYSESFIGQALDYLLKSRSDEW